MRKAKCKKCPGVADNIVVIIDCYKRERYCKSCFTKEFVKCQ